MSGNYAVLRGYGLSREFPGTIAQQVAQIKWESEPPVTEFCEQAKESVLESVYGCCQLSDVRARTGYAKTYLQKIAKTLIAEGRLEKRRKGNRVYWTRIES